MTNASNSETTHNKALEGLFLHAATGIVFIDNHGRIEAANPYAEKLFGYQAGELTGLLVEKLVPEVLHGKNVRYREILFKKPSLTLNKEGLFHQGLHKDGTVFPLELNLTLYEQNGKRTLAAFVNKLNPGLPEHEQLLMRGQSIRMFVEHTPSAVAVFDREMRYILVSKRWLEDFNLGNRNVIGLSHYDIFPDLPQRWKDAHRRGQNGETLHHDEDSFIRADGHREWVSWELCPWYTYSGKIGGITIFSEAITARKEAEEKLQKLNEELELKVNLRTSELADALAKANEMNELKSAFVAMASHEFRTPLSAILSSASIAEKYSDSHQYDKQKKHFLRIKTSVMHLVDILDDFLSLEKLEQGKIKAEKLIFDLRDLIKETIEELSELLKKDQTIQFNYSGETDVLLDKKILRNILNNLLSNAIKYSDQQITLDAEVKAQNVSIRITDKGIGIPIEDQKNIFGKFYRAKNALYIQGTGLGLNIVKNYVDLLGGKISFSSQENSGTTFLLTLVSNHGGKQLLFENAFEWS